MQIYQVPLGAIDLDRAVSFWVERLGARHLATFSNAGLAFVAFGEVRVMFELGGAKGRCYLAVPDVKDFLASLSEAAISVTSPLTPIFDDEEGIFGEPAIELLAFIQDSEGNDVGLSSRVPRDAAQ